MQYKAAIFDMDGLLIDSEPLWQEAGAETLQEFGITLTDEQYHSSTGLRTEEWVDHWFRFFGLPAEKAPEAVQLTIQKAMEKIDASGVVLPGVPEILHTFRHRGFKTGLATSSPMALVDVVMRKLDIRHLFDSFTSAEFLPYGKPHPQVFLDSAASLDVLPTACIVFEDSFNGLIAAKAARMKCVVVPAAPHFDHPKWAAADMKWKSLLDYPTYFKS